MKLKGMSWSFGCFFIGFKTFYAENDLIREETVPALPEVNSFWDVDAVSG